MREHWNSLLTERSWEILKELHKKYTFILIGGWAIYLWTKQQKSKDIDIVVDIKELQRLKQENLSKNDQLKKYEIKFGETDVDIYVAYFSKLSIPVEDIEKYTSFVEGFHVVNPEGLLVLKQGAELSRGNSLKGEKDRIDIMSLLFSADIDLKKYYTILKNYKLDNYIDRLIILLKNFGDYQQFNLSPREFKLKKKDIIDILRRV